MTFAMLTWIKQEIALRPTNSAEREVDDSLRLLGPQYKVLNNLMLQGTGSTTYTQIDHVLVSNYGIFCIETKSHKGLIVAHKSERDWTQFLGTNKFSLPNPLFQNYGHVKALDACIAANGHTLRSGIKSLIIFPFATKILHKDSQTFGELSDVISYIDTYKVAVYSPQERDAIYQTLRNASMQTYSAKQKHIQEVQSKISKTHR